PSIALTLRAAECSAIGYGAVGTAHRHLSREELLAQVAPCSSGQLMRIVGEFLPLGDRATEEVADLAAILVDSRNEDMGGRLSGQLYDQFGKVGLNGPNTRICQCLVEVDFVGGERLDLHHTFRTRSLHNLGN